MRSVRNFCIIAHIDHGKSTLADRLLEVTGTVAPREMKAQLLDSMDLERERGITIKLQPARLQWKGHELNLIDTPGHVDFGYEVSRSLAAVEGAILVVDATQGIEAQTLANLYQAVDQGLTIVPVINKVDLPSADIPRVTSDICHILGCDTTEVIPISAKTGFNIEILLDALVQRIPAPNDKGDAKVQAMIFDSVYDEFQGVIAFVRVMSGEIRAHQPLLLGVAGVKVPNLEVGAFMPKRRSVDALRAGDIGYVVTGLKTLAEVRVGDTLTSFTDPAPALPGYREAKPMVFAGLFTPEGDGYEKLRDALHKLKLNDASLSFEPDASDALGFGFRAGFLGLLHLEIVRERLLREHNVEVIVTAPSVAYHVYLTNGDCVVVHHPGALPNESRIDHIEEPVMRLEVVLPSSYIGAVMPMVADAHGVYVSTEYLDPTRVILKYKLPLASLLVDFYDKLKSVSSGYASLNYDFDGYQPADVVRLDIRVAEEEVEALATMVYRSEAQNIGRKTVEKLKELLPRQMFEVKIQAAVGSKVIASERLPALRKDVLAKMSGGDASRKQKLLKKQKEGKKRMAGQGSVEIPPSAFLAMLKRS